MWPVWENSGSLWSFCNGWDSSPGDQGRRPVISASATFPHYKLAARRPHCSAASWAGITSQPQLSLTQNFTQIDQGVFLLRASIWIWVAPLTSDLAFKKAALAAAFSTSWYCRLVMEKCELLFLCCQMKSMWEEPCITQGCFTAHLFVCVCRTVPQLSPCLQRDLEKLFMEWKSQSIMIEWITVNPKEFAEFSEFRTEISSQQQH